LKTLALSARASLLRPSPTLGTTAKANAMRAAGIDVISFAAGEPDFNTPQTICDTAIEALHEGFTKYTPSAGILPLREAIAHKLARENSLSYDPAQIIVSCGAKHSIYNSLQVLADPGDEVILIAPYWMTYADQIRLAGATPVVVHGPASTGFVPSIESIAAAVSPRTKAIILNSPSNPTGGMVGEAFLRGLAELAVKHGFWIISDEIYERLTYGQAHVSIASLGREVADLTITVGGCSKSYAMTGWRIGFAAAPLSVVKAMSNFQDQVTSNPTSFAQRGAVTAFNLPAETVEAMRAEFEARRNLMVKLLREIPKVNVPEPSGAFYVFPDVSAYMGGDDAALADHLLEHAHVAAVAGSVFEGAGHLRMSYATSRENIQRGVERISGALAALA
jgi:aspartate aminotransferase